MKKDRIIITGMRFLACHGCLPEEKTTPQPFTADVTLFLPLKAAGKGDDIACTVDYTKVFAVAESVMTGKSVDLIETLAERIAERIFEEFGSVRKVSVTVHKPNSPLMDRVSDVAVTIERRK